MRIIAISALALASVACATSSSATTSNSPAADCPTTCARQKDACLAKAGPPPASDQGAPQQVSQQNWSKSFEQQKAVAACNDDYQSCTGHCSP